MAVETSYNVSI